jgi:hypothetical protein
MTLYLLYIQYLTPHDYFTDSSLTLRSLLFTIYYFLRNPHRYDYNIVTAAADPQVPSGTLLTYRYTQHKSSTVPGTVR